MRRFLSMTIPFSQNTPVETFAFLLLPRFSNHCLANTLEPLRAANALSGRELYRWQLVSLQGDAVVSSSGLEIRAGRSLSGLNEADVLLVLSSYDYRRQWTPELQSQLKRKARRFTLIGGLDTGSYLLARAGLLDGYRATIHWQELGALEEEFPRVHAVSDRFVIDRNRITAGGATTALDLMLHIIGERYGEALRLDVCALFIYDRPHAGGDPQRALHLAAAPGQAPMVASAISIMESNLEEPLSIGEIGRRSGCTQRELAKRFRRALGATPLFYYRHLRLAAARRMVLETERRVSEIAVRTGFGSASALTRAFREHFGDTPRRVRAGVR